MIHVIRAITPEVVLDRGAVKVDFDFSDLSTLVKMYDPLENEALDRSAKIKVNNPFRVVSCGISTPYGVIGAVKASTVTMELNGDSTIQHIMTSDLPFIPTQFALSDKKSWVSQGDALSGYLDVVLSCSGELYTGNISDDIDGIGASITAFVVLDIDTFALDGF